MNGYNLISICIVVLLIGVLFLVDNPSAKEWQTLIVGGFGFLGVMATIWYNAETDLTLVT